MFKSIKTIAEGISKLVVILRAKNEISVRILQEHVKLRLTLNAIASPEATVDGPETEENKMVRRQMVKDNLMLDEYESLFGNALEPSEKNSTFDDELELR